MMQLTKVGKNQNRLLIAFIGAIILLFIAWNGAFRKTIDAYRVVRDLKTGISSMEQNTLKKQQLQIQTSKLNSVLGIGENKMQTESVFEELVGICKKIEAVRIINFPDIHQIEVNGYKVTTIFATFEGSYSDLLTLVYNLERDKKTGRLVSVDFKKNKDIKNGNEFLSLTILLQNYELVSQQ